MAGAGNINGDLYDDMLVGAHRDSLNGTVYLYTYDINVGVVDEPGPILSEFTLGQNYPNPFNPSTQIEYAVPEPGYYTITVYNVLGEEVTKLLSSYMPAGRHTVNFSAEGLSSGIYLYRLQGENSFIVKKMMLMK